MPALIVCRRQPTRHLNAVVDGLAQWQRSGLKPLAQALSLQQFRDDVGGAVVLANVVDRQNVGVIERGCRLGLRLETPQAVAVFRKGGR